MPSVRNEILPAILVGAGIHRRGGVSYARTVLEETQEGATETKRWETRKTIDDAEEFRQAENLANSLRRKVAKVCSRTSFGLVCPESKEAELDDVIAAVREDAQKANAGLVHCSLSVAFVKGRIKNDDAEAAKAIVKEINTFLAELTAAITAADPKVIRQVLASAKGLDALLEPHQGELLQNAITAARAVAKKVKKEIIDKGRSLELVMQGMDTSAIDTARLAFLELEAEEPVAAPQLGGGRIAAVAEEVAG